MDPYVLGIDPGLTGALALWRCGEIAVVDMPLFDVKVAGRKRRDLNLHGVLKHLLPIAFDIKSAYIEAVHSMPQQGVASTFTFGYTYGALLGILASLQIPFLRVAPNIWKPIVGLAAGADKGVSRRRASELFPGTADEFSRVKDDGRAEAALIAYYGARQLQLV